MADSFVVASTGVTTEQNELIENIDKKTTAIADHLGVSWDIEDVDTPRYGFCIDKVEAQPGYRVTYLGAAKGKEPAHMNYQTGTFDYGGWKDIWFIKKNKPCMVKSATRQIDYYLDPNDYTRREGTTITSDVNNPSYAGNAMATIPLCYLYQYEENDKQYCWICEKQYNSNYKAYAHTRADGTIAPYFYWPLFGASSINSIARSIGNQTLAQSQTAETQINQAKANGTGWDIQSWSQRNLIQMLLILIGHSTDTQTTFGNGNCQEATSEEGLLKTGTLETKGQFWGSTANNQQVKVFHCEGVWGDQWLRTNGVFNMADGSGIIVKMTPPYNLTGSGYIKTGIVPSGTSGGYISQTKMSEYGMIPSVYSGSGTTYYCDGGWFNNSQFDMLFAGAGANNTPAIGGALSFVVDNSPSNAWWDIGSALSCEYPA